LIRQKLESLKGATMDETANNIKEALIREGATKARLLRSALKILYPDELLKRDEAGKRQVRELLKKYNFAGARKPPRPSSSLNPAEAFGRIPASLIEEKRKEVLKNLTAQTEPEGTTSGEVIIGPPPPTTAPKPGQKKGK
jgi:hypothetical protein